MRTSDSGLFSSRRTNGQGLEQMDTIFREVFSQLSQADSVRLLPCIIFASAKSGVDLAQSVSEALTTTMQPRVDIPMDTAPELKGTTGPSIHKKPSLKHKKWDCPACSTQRGSQQQYGLH